MFTSMRKNSTLRTECRKIMFDGHDKNDSHTSVILTLALLGRLVGMFALERSEGGNVTRG